ERVETPARYYTPKRKESLARIARRWGTSSSRLRKLNGLGSKVATVRAGTRLKVKPSSVSTVITDENGRRRVIASRVAAASSAATSRSTPRSASPAKTPVARAAAARNTKGAKSDGRAESVHALRISTKGNSAKRRAPRM